MFGQLLCDIEYVAVDFESAGQARGLTDQPVQIAWAVLRHQVIAPEDFFVSYLQCHRPITWSAAKVHGITTEHLRSAPTLLSLWPQVKSAFENSVVVAHGAGTEKRFLRTYPFHGFGPWVDTLVMARRVYPDLADYSLSSLVQTLGLEKKVRDLCPDRTWHDALFDAVASLVLWQHLTHQFSPQATLIEVLS
jgi:DNA polymerase-3 subunit epsilon